MKLLVGLTILAILLYALIHDWGNGRFKKGGF